MNLRIIKKLLYKRGSSDVFISISKCIFKQRSIKICDTQIDALVKKASQNI